jgi:hypothetical protein
MDLPLYTGMIRYDIIDDVIDRALLFAKRFHADRIEEQ